MLSEPANECNVQKHDLQFSNSTIEPEDLIRQNAINNLFVVFCKHFSFVVRLRALAISLILFPARSRQITEVLDPTKQRLKRIIFFVEEKMRRKTTTTACGIYLSVLVCGFIYTKKKTATGINLSLLNKLASGLITCC